MIRPARLLLAAAALACGGGSDPDTVRLRFVYAEGDTLAYEYASAGTATLPDSTGGDGTFERGYARRMRIEEVATDVTPGGDYLLDLEYHLESDSLYQADMPQRIALRVQITPQGRILDVSGVETARRLYGDIDFRSYFDQSQPVFPDRPLKVGDSWTQEVRVLSPTSEPVVTSSTYVLESLTEENGEPIAVIAYDGDIYLPVQTDEEEGDGRLVFEERIRVRGRIHFAHERGVVRRLETSSEATFTRISLEDGEPVRRAMELREESTMQLLDRP